MKVEKTNLEGVLIITPDVYGDARGWFYESYTKSKLEPYGLAMEFIQDNQSLSVPQYTLRGIHFQKAPYAQSKLVRCIAGKIMDVAVDLRSNSKTYGKWTAVELSAEDKKQIFIPKGFGHAFLTLEPNTQVCYKVDAPYHKASEGGINWKDPDIAIDWPVEEGEVLLSDKDLAAPFLKECRPFF